MRDGDESGLLPPTVILDPGPLPELERRRPDDAADAAGCRSA